MLDAKNEHYCKIYVDTKMQFDDLVRLVEDILSGVARRRTVVVSWGELDVLKSHDYDSARARAERSGFIFFPYHVDVFPAENLALENCTREIGNLLTRLWQNECMAVAACDYEGSLPESGGISRFQRELSPPPSADK